MSEKSVVEIRGFKYRCVERLNRSRSGKEVLRVEDINDRSEWVLIRNKIENRESSALLQLLLGGEDSKNYFLLPEKDRSEIISSGKESFLVYPFCETLESYVKNSPSMKDRLKAVREVIESIWKLHSKGFCHGDIKPKNILLHNGRFKLHDFEQSFTIPVKDRGGGGTPPYKYSHFLIEYYDIRDEIFALLVTLYFILTGQKLIQNGQFTEFWKEELSKVASIFSPNLKVEVKHRSLKLSGDEKTLEKFKQHIRDKNKARALRDRIAEKINHFTEEKIESEIKEPEYKNVLLPLIELIKDEKFNNLIGQGEKEKEELKEKLKEVYTGILSTIDSYLSKSTEMEEEPTDTEEITEPDKESNKKNEKTQKIKKKRKKKKIVIIPVVLVLMFVFVGWKYGISFMETREEIIPNVVCKDASFIPSEKVIKIISPEDRITFYRMLPSEFPDLKLEEVNDSRIFELFGLKKEESKKMGNLMITCDNGKVKIVEGE